jgi:hypothetical protein
MDIGAKRLFAVTDANGRFRFAVPDQSGDLPLSMSVFGYKPRSLTGLFQGSEKLLLDTLFLTPDTLSLNAVTVIAKKIITVSPDKISYAVKADSTNRGLTAIEVIQKVPFIDVGVSERLYVNGQTNFRILINGKYSGVANQNPAAYLKNLPTSALDRIEVISDPPVKYRQEGIEKLINIITVSGLSQGFYMTLNSNFDSRFGYNAGYYTLFRSKKLSLGSNLNVGKTKGVWSEYEYKSSSASVTVQQSGQLLNRSTSLTPALEATYEVDSLRLLSFSAYGSFNDLNTLFETSNDYRKPGIHTRSNTSTNSEKESNFYHFALDYEHVLKGSSRKSVLTISTKLLHNFNRFESRIQQSDWTFPISLYNITTGTGNEITHQIDIVKSRRNVSFNAGLKHIYRDMKSADASQKFRLKQNVSIPYTDIKYELTQNKFIKIGANFEFLTIKYAGLGNNLDIHKKFLNVNPRLGWYASINKNRSYSLIYGLSARRPGVRYLSPVISFISPDLVQYGNPRLKQEFNHLITFSYNTTLLKKFLSVSFYNRFTNSGIIESRRPYLDTAIAITFVNGGRNLTLGNTLYYSMMAGKRISIRLNSDVAYQKMKFQGQAKDALYYKIFLTTTCKLPQNFSLTLYNFLYSRTITYQGYQSGYPDISIVLSNKFVKNKMNTSLILYQPFISRFRQDQQFEDFSMSQFSSTTFPTRYIGFRISYDFGNIAKAYGGRKKQKGIVNDDLKE